MPLYNVHLYREIKLTFENYEANTPEQAAQLASEELSGNADDIQDCEGVNLAALVDLVGDEEFTQSLSVDFEAERQRIAASKLVDALRTVVVTEYDRDEESRNFDEERLQYFASLIAEAA